MIINAGIKPFKKECMEGNLRIKPQLKIIYRELLKTKYSPNPDRFILKKPQIICLTKQENKLISE
jgi:hypothetical protein